MLGDVVVLFLFFEKPSDCFAQWLYRFTFLPTVHRVPFSLHPNPRVFQSGFLVDAVSASPRFLPATPECSSPLPTARICTCLPEGFSEPWAFLRHTGWAGRKEWGILIPEHPQPRTDVTVCLVTQSCPTLCDPMDYRPPGSSVYGIFPAKLLEWVAISSSSRYSWPRDQTCISCIGRQTLYH